MAAVIPIEFAAAGTAVRERHLTFDDLCHRFGREDRATGKVVPMPVRTARRRLKGIRGIKLGKTWHYPLAEVEAFERVLITRF